MKTLFLVVDGHLLNESLCGLSSVWERERARERGNKPRISHLQPPLILITASPLYLWVPHCGLNQPQMESIQEKHWTCPECVPDHFHYHYSLTRQYNKHFYSISIILSIKRTRDNLKHMRDYLCRLYGSIMPLYIKDLHIHRFWYPQGFWIQSFEDIEGGLYFLKGPISKYDHPGS